MSYQRERLIHTFVVFVSVLTVEIELFNLQLIIKAGVNLFSHPKAELAEQERS